MNGACPMDLKVMYVSREGKIPVGDESQLTEANALQQIMQLDFIEKDAIITPINLHKH